MIRVLPRTLLSLATLVALAGCEAKPAPSPESAEVSGLPYYNEASFTPRWYESPSAVPDTFHAVAPFSLTDQRGRTVTEAELDGRITVANFFYTSCPGICPTTMANMGRVQEAFDGGVSLLSHSITPGRDSTAALRVFAERMHVLDDHWRLVTGDRETMYALGKRSYFADEDLGEAQTQAEAGMAFTHTESFFLIDSDRRIRGIYNGMNSAAVTQLIADVQTLQQEAALALAR